MLRLADRHDDRRHAGFLAVEQGGKSLERV
jgi:hypothetical protein